MRILLVEDDDSTREIISLLLVKRGHEVTACANAASAEREFLANPFPLALLDVMLKGDSMDGLELCRRFRLHPDGQACVIVVCTARRSIEDLKSVLTAGADDYMSKPLDPEMFAIRMGIAEHLSTLKLSEREKRKLDLQIQHAQRLESLGVLAGGIAHDFNNLLVGVIGNADLALLELSPHSPVRKRIEGIKAAGIRAADLTKQMLAYSGKGKFVNESIDLNQLIEEMWHLLEVSVPKNVILKLKLAPNLPALEGDPSQLMQVVMNLITNAAEAIGKKSGIICISTGLVEADRQYLSEVFVNNDLPEGFYIYLEVSDTGCGMDETTRKKIFDPFFSTKFTGRGLGLAAVLGIVQAHHGAVKVYSEPGKGTTFKIMFAASKHPFVAKSAIELDDFEGWKANETILIIDDEEDMRTIVKLALERYSLKVLTAENGATGVEVYRKHGAQINLVILDLTMPVMSGEEAFRELRRINQNVRVLLTSGYNEQDVTNNFAGKGLVGFMQKPLRLKSLIEKLREALAAPGA